MITLCKIGSDILFVCLEREHRRQEFLVCSLSSLPARLKKTTNKKRCRPNTKILVGVELEQVVLLELEQQAQQTQETGEAT
jgi:hypothetical protein